MIRPFHWRLVVAVATTVAVAALAACGPRQDPSAGGGSPTPDVSPTTTPPIPAASVAPTPSASSSSVPALNGYEIRGNMVGWDIAGWACTLNVDGYLLMPVDDLTPSSERVIGLLPGGQIHAYWQVGIRHSDIVGNWAFAGPDGVPTGITGHATYYEAGSPSYDGPFTLTVGPATSDPLGLLTDEACAIS